MKVTYLTYPWFLDFSVEFIKSLSEEVILDVIVVCPLDRMASTIYKVNKNEIIDNFVYDFDEIDFLAHKDLFRIYFQKAHTVKFVFLKKKWYDPKNYRINKQIIKLFNTANPDVIHFDDLYFYLFWLPIVGFKHKYIINIHDPVPHTGEKDWKRDLIRFLFFKRKRRIITYSAYSSNLFKQAYPKIKNVTQLELPVYTFYRRLAGERIIQGKYVLFFGRISPYKGVDRLLETFGTVNNPQEIKLVIAGKSIPGYSLPVLTDMDNIVVINDFVSNEDLASLIHFSSAVICPYIDATQSGVLMTSLAFEKYMLVSDVGAFPEIITPDNGLTFSYGLGDDFKNKLQYLLNRVSTTDETTNTMQAIDNLKDNIDKLIAIYESI